MMMAVKDVCTLEASGKTGEEERKLSFVLRNAIVEIFLDKLKIDWQIAIVGFFRKVEHDTIQFSPCRNMNDDVMCYL